MHLHLCEMNFVCPKCHPYVAGCVVIVMFLFKYFHGDEIATFFSFIVNNTLELSNDTQPREVNVHVPRTRSSNNSDHN